MVISNPQIMSSPVSTSGERRGGCCTRGRVSYPVKGFLFRGGKGRGSGGEERWVRLGVVVV